MANKKESNGNGTSIVSMFEQVAETGFGEVQTKTSVLRVYLLFRHCLTKEENSSEYQPDAEEGDIFLRYEYRGKR